MAENNVEPEPDWNDRALDTAEDTLVAMQTLLATLRAFEDVLRQQDISAISSTEYCDNFCQALMHYAGSRNSMEHGLPLLEVYCLSISCFADARSHLTAESESVALVLKRLALSCFELLLSVPENEIPFEAWVQFHQAVQIAHTTLHQYGSTDLQALLQITGEGGAWTNPILTALLTGQPANPDEVNAYIGLEGEGFMEMRVKHLEKMGDVAKAAVLAKACSECSLISNQATFRQTYVSFLCHLLPSEEAIVQISTLDCKDVLEITSNLETEGEENTAFILCTTFLTQQLQQQSLYCSWELTLLWCKLQRKIDPSLESLLERCLQLGAIAKTVCHLLYLVRVIRAEAEELGLASSVELCVKALQLPKQDDSDTRVSVCKTVSRLLPDDLEVLRACLLTEFLLGPSQEVFSSLEELHKRPDQKYDQEKGVIPNSLRCELLLALKAHWPFDPEFWDWKTLKYRCITLLGLRLESEGDEDDVATAAAANIERQDIVFHEPPVKNENCVESVCPNGLSGSVDGHEEQHSDKPATTIAQGRLTTKKPKFLCQICKRAVAETQLICHSRRHAEDNINPCPVCLERFQSRKKLVPHMKTHLNGPNYYIQYEKKKREFLKKVEEEDEIEPGELGVDPSIVLYYEATHDRDALRHILQQAKSAKLKRVDNDEHVTFDYIDMHFNLRNRDEYPCPGTLCTKTFKHSKYLYVHLKSDHQGDDNVKHFLEMRDRREKCVFCRRHSLSPYHHRKHLRMHYGNQPYLCVVVGCGAQFCTPNELMTHRQTHGYQLNYQCELKGCYVTCSDLGQMYHHEAQHFREAAFSCSSPECKKFYLSKKEFLKHLATHGITFSEEDFKARRKSKQNLFETASAEVPCPKMIGDSKVVLEGMANGDLISSSTSCASSLQESDCKEPKGIITSVAVCFDGSKFTCGFEKCGMTFSRARDVQRHFKCAHPEHLKMESKEHGHDGSQSSRSKGIKMKTEMSREQNDKCEISKSFPLKATGKERKSAPRPNHKDTSISSLERNDTLKEILVQFSKLDLNSSDPHNDQCALSNSLSQSNVSQNSLHQAIMAKSPIVLLHKKHVHLPEKEEEEEEKQKGKSSSQISEGGNVSSVETLATAKPYICEWKGCDFRTAQSFSLLRHYTYIHGCTVGKARELTSLKTTSFKPYVCQICSKCHREKCVLRAHYIQVHNLSEAALEKMNCISPRREGSKATELQNETTCHLVKSEMKAKKKRARSWRQRYRQRKSSIMQRENAKNANNQAPSKEEEEVENDLQDGGNDNGQNDKPEDEASQQGRTTRRQVAKSNLCYILAKFNKPFHCVAKGCNAAFSTQGGLVRHLQLVHRYNRSQLLLEKDFDTNQNNDCKKDAVKKRPASQSDEPQPQYKCGFAKCNASYHLKSSLVRHTRDLHCQPLASQMRCKFEGCPRVFYNASALKKHILYSHCEYYDSLVLRLQSTHKKSISGCKKKLIVAPPPIALSLPKEETNLTNSQTPAPIPEPEQAEMSEKSDEAAEVENKKSTDFSYNSFTYRSHEEALQMCQDRCLPYPCMIQDCDSVVTYDSSLHRHYLRTHRMGRKDISGNEDKLVLNAEQLEELIQRKSAQPTIISPCTPNGVCKMEYQAEPENTEGQPTTVSLNSIKAETLAENGCDALIFPDEEMVPPVKRNIFGADVMYGEANAGRHTEETPPTTQASLNQEKPQRKNTSPTEEPPPTTQASLNQEKPPRKNTSPTEEPPSTSQASLNQEKPQRKNTSPTEEPPPTTQASLNQEKPPRKNTSPTEEPPSTSQASLNQEKPPRKNTSPTEEPPSTTQASLNHVKPRRKNTSPTEEPPSTTQASLNQEKPRRKNTSPTEEPPSTTQASLNQEKPRRKNTSPTEEPLSTTQASLNQEKPRRKSTNTTHSSVSIDLSPPSSLRFTNDESSLETSSSKAAKINGSGALVLASLREPLKRKNELSEQLSNVKETKSLPSPTLSFDIATYKPMGFESSFLKFIQETTPLEEDSTITSIDPIKHSCSVKENNELGVTLLRSKRTRSSQPKSLAITKYLRSIQNVKSILDKAGCGDLAIKQLQYLRPVVVLERPVCTIVLPDLPSDIKNSKLLIGR